MSSGGVGAEGMEINFATHRHPGTNTKRSQVAFAATSIALNLVLLRIVEVSRVVSIEVSVFPF